MVLMETLFLCIHLLVLAGICVQSTFAFPSTHHHRQYASLQLPQIGQTQSSKHPVHKEQKHLGEEREKVHTIRVTCRPDSMEIVIKADMFGVGAPVESDELRLGVEDDDYCRATAFSGDEYKIVVGLVDCGTKHWITGNSLVYTNLLIYTPGASPYGLIRMDEAVVPIECHYERKYSLSSSSLTPTWIPFTVTQAAVETLIFDLRIMTSDWLYERSSNVFYLGESISIEASVSVGHHVGLRVFMSTCVATLNPDTHSVPKYVFIKNGCLVDSQLPGSRSHFLQRTQEQKLRLVIDTFRFHNEDRGELYITCQLNAVPLNSAEAPNKACTFANKRWRSADGNDYLCRYCQSQSQDGQTLIDSSPRGFGKPAEPEALWRSGQKTNNVWEQEARVGPMLVLPGKHKSGSLPVEEPPPVLQELIRPVLYGSQWRSGITTTVYSEKGQLPLPKPHQGNDDQSETNLNAQEKGLLPIPPFTPDLEDADGDDNRTDVNDLEKGLLPSLLSTPDLVEDNDDKSGTDVKDLEKGLLLPFTPFSVEKNGYESATDLKEGDAEDKVTAAPKKAVPDFKQKLKVAEVDNDNTADLSDIGSTTRVQLDMTSLSNATATDSNLLDANDPKI